MDFKNSVFETRKDIDLEENISNMPFNQRYKLDYIWYAETVEGGIPQFDVDGNENKYSKVRDVDAKNDLKGLWWVPVNNDSVAYGVYTKKAANPEMMRIGRKNVDMATGRVSDERCYRIETNSSNLYIFRDGEVMITNAADINPWNKKANQGESP